MLTPKIVVFPSVPVFICCHVLVDFHSHPYDNDNVPSQDDYDVMASIYHEKKKKTSKIVTPNGRITVYSHRGVVEIGTVSNKIDDKHKKALLKLFGGK